MSILIKIAKNFFGFNFNTSPIIKLRLNYIFDKRSVKLALIIYWQYLKKYLYFFRDKFFKMIYNNLILFINGCDLNWITDITIN